MSRSALLLVATALCAVSIVNGQSNLLQVNGYSNAQCTGSPVVNDFAVVGFGCEIEGTTNSNLITVAGTAAAPVITVNVYNTTSTCTGTYATATVSTTGCTNFMGGGYLKAVGYVAVGTQYWSANYYSDNACKTLVSNGNYGLGGCNAAAGQAGLNSFTATLGASSVAFSIYTNTALCTGNSTVAQTFTTGVCTATSLPFASGAYAMLSIATTTAGSSDAVHTAAVGVGAVAAVVVAMIANKARFF